ncbi:MAG TPA: DUF4386 domain-containing protein [Gammaproteobacteria bacterium]|jgi:hypothetical protein|nr:DUF4386 domain-containing protein [Gammaproteobacteria bacterium]
MTPTSKRARITGFLYLLLVFFGPLRLIYIPNTLFVHGDATATAANIMAHQTLFQSGIFCDLWGGVTLVLVSVAFWQLFKDVDRIQAMLLVIFGGVLQAAVYFFNVMNDEAALMLVRGGSDYLSVFTEPQRDALAYLFTRLHFQVILGAEILWGIWLFPMAILTLKSRYFPRFLAWWLILNGLFYLLLSFTGFYFFDHLDSIANYGFPLQFGEVAFILWLLVFGAKEPSPAAKAA